MEKAEDTRPGHEFGISRKSSTDRRPTNVSRHVSPGAMPTRQRQRGCDEICRDASYVDEKGRTGGRLAVFV